MVANRKAPAAQVERAMRTRPEEEATRDCDAMCTGVSCSSVVDFTFSPYSVELSHVSNKPRPRDPFKNVVAPFTNEVWFGVVLVVVLVGACFLGIHTVYTAVLGLERVKKGPRYLLDFAVLPLSILVNQKGLKGFKRRPRWTSAGSVMKFVKI